MPWKEPGKGSKDPWSSGDQPPDLEEVFRNVNRRLKGLFGGGGGHTQNPSGRNGMVPVNDVVSGCPACRWQQDVKPPASPGHGALLQFAQVTAPSRSGGRFCATGPWSGTASSDTWWRAASSRSTLPARIASPFPVTSGTTGVT